MERFAMTVGLFTLGCKVSQYETEAISEEFERRGFLVKDFSESCDVYVINTCTVTAESDRKCRQVIRRAARSNPKAKILVCGCYSQRSPKEVAEIDGVDAVIGSSNKMTLPDIAEQLLMAENSTYSPVCRVGNIDEAPFESMRITKGPRTRVYVKIEDGCECRCTYCAIPSARGRVRSKSREDVIAEVEALAKSGVKEIVLTGIETGSYGADFDEKYRLSDLLCELDRRGSAERIRLGSLAPELIGEDFSSAVSSLKSLAPHFHISVQSGSDNVLRAMKRRYTRDTALRNIERLRQSIKGVQFTTDLMVGFPGETEEDFLATVDFVKQARFISCHVFAYSRRHSTPAADYPGQIPEQIKRRRSEELIRVCSQVRDEVLREAVEVGNPISCIFETVKDGMMFGHSECFFEVAAKAEEKLRGEVCKVLPVSQKDGIIYGKVI